MGLKEDIPRACFPPASEPSCWLLQPQMQEQSCALTAGLWASHAARCLRFLPGGIHACHHPAENQPQPLQVGCPYRQKIWPYKPGRSSENKKRTHVIETLNAFSSTVRGTSSPESFHKTAFSASSSVLAPVVIAKPLNAWLPLEVMLEPLLIPESINCPGYLPLVPHKEP